MKTGIGHWALTFTKVTANRSGIGKGAVLCALCLSAFASLSACSAAAGPELSPARIEASAAKVRVVSALAVQSLAIKLDATQAANLRAVLATVRAKVEAASDVRGVAKQAAAVAVAAMPRLDVETRAKYLRVVNVAIDAVDAYLPIPESATASAEKLKPFLVAARRWTLAALDGALDALPAAPPPE